jgi:hypothetical protein
MDKKVNYFVLKFSIILLLRQTSAICNHECMNFADKSHNNIDFNII